MEAVTSSNKVIVCETCGDKGFTYSFVYCVKCLDFAIHRYCLNVMPKTLYERVIWFCEDCKVKTSQFQKNKAETMDIELDGTTNHDPVWRGSFIIDTNDDKFEGLVAHLSNKACTRVIKEANMLPSLLHLKMHPKNVLWPKSFHEFELSDDNIALYFFPASRDQIIRKTFDCLVSNMMNKGLAMRATAENAELLIFPSLALHPLFQKFEEKYYLWGVFRGNNDSTSQETPIDVKRMPTRVKTSDFVGTRIPLSSKDFKMVRSQKTQTLNKFSNTEEDPIDITEEDTIDSTEEIRSPHKEKKKLKKQEMKKKRKIAEETSTKITNSDGNHIDASLEEEQQPPQDVESGKEQEKEIKDMKRMQSKKRESEKKSFDKGKKKLKVEKRKKNQNNIKESVDKETHDDNDTVDDSAVNDGLELMLCAVLSKMKNQETIKLQTEKSKRKRTLKVQKKKEPSSDKNEKRKTKYPLLKTRTSPKSLSHALESMTKEQKQVVQEIGFGKLLNMKLDGISLKLAFYVVNKLDAKRMEIKLEKGTIKITKDVIHDILGVPNSGTDLFSLKKSKNENVKWRKRYGIQVSAIKLLNNIIDRKETNWNFKLDFLCLFACIMGDCQKSGLCKLSPAQYLNQTVKIEEIDWCKFVFRSLQRSKKNWNEAYENLFYAGPVTVLLLIYLDNVKCNKYNVERLRPAILGWTKDRMKRREEIEIKMGGFGLGSTEKKIPKKKIQKQTLQDFLSRLETLHNWIDKENEQFEKLWLEADELFEGDEALQMWKKKHERLFTRAWVNVEATQKDNDQNKDNPNESEENDESDNGSNDSDGGDDDGCEKDDEHDSESDSSSDGGSGTDSDDSQGDDTEKESNEENEKANQRESVIEQRDVDSLEKEQETDTSSG